MPKKAGKKAGKKGKKDDADEGGPPTLTPEDMLEQANATILALQRELELRREESMRSVAAQRELQERILSFHRDFQREKEDRLDITADMTRQYKAMQDELIDRVNKLEEANAELRDQLELSRTAYEELRREKESVLSLRDAEIAELRQKMEEMSQEFADMLRETLDKMSEKVEKSSSKWESETKMPGKERLAQFHLGHVDL